MLRIHGSWLMEGTVINPSKPLPQPQPSGQTMCHLSLIWDSANSLCFFCVFPNSTFYRGLCYALIAIIFSLLKGCTIGYWPSLPNISTPRAAKMKKRRKKRRPRLPTYGKGQVVRKFHQHSRDNSAKVFRYTRANAWKSAKIPKSSTINAWKCVINNKSVCD